MAEHLAQARRFADLAATELVQKGKRATLLNCVGNPAIKFVRDYLVKFGFLDGRAGAAIGAISAYATYRKYASLRALTKAGAPS